MSKDTPIVINDQVADMIDKACKLPAVKEEKRQILRAQKFYRKNGNVYLSEIILAHNLIVDSLVTKIFELNGVIAETSVSYADSVMDEDDCCEDETCPCHDDADCYDDKFWNKLESDIKWVSEHTKWNTVRAHNRNGVNVKSHERRTK